MQTNIYIQFNVCCAVIQNSSQYCSFISHENNFLFVKLTVAANLTIALQITNSKKLLAKIIFWVGVLF